MKLREVEHRGSKVYFTIGGKVYVLNKAILAEYGNCEVKGIHILYGKCYLDCECGV